MKIAFGIACMVVVLASSTVFADARQHFMAGQDYYTQGRYQKAIEEFEEAYRLDPRPLLLFNIAQAHEKMGNIEKAVDFLKKYLQADPNTEERDTLLNKIANLEARLAEQGVTVACNEAEATVYVDGTERGKTPVAGVLRLSVGAHKIQVSKKGFKDFVMNVAVASGQSTPVDVVLEPGVAGPAPQPEKPAGEGGEKGGETPPDEGGSSTMDVLPWVIAGVGGAAVIGGWGVLGGMALSAEDHDKAVMADIIGGIGTVLLAAGAGWGIYNLTAGESDTEPAAAVAPTVVPDGAGISAVIAF